MANDFLLTDGGGFRVRPMKHLPRVHLCF